MNRWDAIVVGAGPAGTLAAETLQQHGVRVLVLDGGPRPESGGDIPDIDEGTWQYESVGSELDWLRVRAVGGASLAWGGWCNRFPERVFRRSGWPFGADEMAPSYAAIEKRIQVVPEALGRRYQECALSLGLRVTAMHASRLRGLAWNALQSPIAERVQAGTVVTSIEGGHAGPGILHASVDGRARQFPFKLLLLACSPVETARLLLASDPGLQCPGVGRGLTYHPVAGYALIEPPVATQEPATAALVVCDGSVRGDSSMSFTVELTGPYTFHELAPDLKARVRVREEPAPDSRITFIHCLGELMPHEGRFVDLSEALDTLGRRRPRIHLFWTEAELALIDAMQTTALRIAESLVSVDAQLIEYLDPLAAPMLFHEAGTCAFGGQANPPCDPYGRLRGTSRVWVADASVFPSSGDRHPTLTILAHARRAATAAAASLAG